MGGGIGFTVRHSAAASEEELLRSLLTRMDRMLRYGTTTAEAKSGYGLIWANELKLLKVLHAANHQAAHPVELVSNYCAAHSKPQGVTAAEHTADIVQKQLPA